MLILRRLLHTSGPGGVLSKSNLAKLRKRTGFSFVNCKKALEKYEQDVDKAEAWLQEQAQKEGWTKATKLKDRATSEGLIGLAFANHNNFSAAMVEVNCETDFVARNESFQNFVNQVAMTTLTHYRKDCEQLSEPVKISISGNDLASLKADSGQSLQDLTALTIGQVKENMTLRRALCMFVPADHYLGHYVHSPLNTIKDKDSFCQMGKYGSLVAFQQKGKVDKHKFQPGEFGRRLCQHIIGMNPLNIGEYTRPPPSEVENQDVEVPKPDEEASKGFSDSEDNIPAPPEEELPTEMLQQEYLLNPSICVGEHLLEHKVTILDFARFEIGENIDGGS
ncbi:elongation factor Ts, mitochondrial-like [Amphiura filiformis]|uniref:elongation factor Ts, mitochondrial-like n=1 Tax=Amphiura filiformis TaxID=82378 RepID=UPI003B20ECB0